MKTLLTVLLFLLFANLTSLRAAYDDWTDAKLPSTDGMIENVSLIDGMNGIACGLNITGRKHMILQTSDGGDTWSIVDLSSVADFEPFNIYQKDVNTWFAVGQNANQNSDDYNKIMIIKTTDQGVSWTKMNLPDLKGYISAICFSSDNKGVITGDFNNGENPIILYTNDGGANWQEANFKQETYQRARHPFFIDENNGWVVLNSYKIGIKLLKTTDGGANWTEISNPVNEKGIFSGVYFVDENIGWIYGLITEGKRHGFLYVTKDGGMSWHNVDLRIPNGNGNETVGLDEVAIFSFIVSPTEEDDIYSGYLSAQSMDFRNEYTIITNITLDNSNVMMSKKNYNSNKSMDLKGYFKLLKDYELFMSCYKKIRLSNKKTQLSKTRIGINSFIDWLSDHTTSSVLETNVIPYPTAKYKLLKKEPPEIINKAKLIFFETLNLFEPSVIILHGKPSLDNFLDILNNNGILINSSLLKKGLKKLKKKYLYLLSLTNQGNMPQ